MIEKKYKPIINGFFKRSDGGSTNAMQNLRIILWLDQSNKQTPINLINYHISYSNDSFFLLSL